jgi:RNA polymerase sigma-70 factor (ECF subfamily)
MLLSVLRGIGSRPNPKRRAPDTARPAAEGPSDASLVRRARAGDTQAAAALYRRHLNYVLGMSVRMIGTRADGEDVTQEVFAIALERLDSLSDPGAFRAWAAQIAVNLIRKRIRRQQLVRLLGMDRRTPDATLEMLAVSHGNAEARAELALLDVALGRLPANQRIAWMLRYVEGEELETVARLTACSLATVKRRIARAAAGLSAHLEDGAVDQAEEDDEEDST